MALEELSGLLPRITVDDAELLDSPAIRDLAGRPLDLLPSLLGEEAFGLATFAAFADGRMTSEGVLSQESAGAPVPVWDSGAIFRVFFLPGDIDGYRQLMHGFQQLAARRDEAASHAESIRRAEALERTLEKRQGVLSRLLFPALKAVFLARSRAEAAHRAAATLVAATKQRLESATLPLGPDEFKGTPPYAVPADPFVEGRSPLVMRRVDAGLAVYSVGPDGEDDGGPVPLGDEADDGNDDVGLVMAVR